MTRWLPWHLGLPGILTLVLTLLTAAPAGAGTDVLLDSQVAAPSPVLVAPTLRPTLEWEPTRGSEAPGTTGPRERRQAAQSSADLTLDERKAIQARLKLRRKMVPIHQTLAFVAAGTIIATDVIGMINQVSLRTGSPETLTRDEIEGTLILHRVLVATATTTYLGAGLMAWTMPPAYKANAKAKKKSKKVDSGEVHIAMSVMHGIAMGTAVATGILQANQATGEAWDVLLGVHTAAGLTAAVGIIGAGIVIGTM